MTNKSKRMGTVLWLAAQTERAAAERLIASRRELDDLNQKLAHLRAGRDEYLTRLRMGTTMSVTEMRELRHFVEKLDGVITQLQHQVQHKEQVNTQHQGEWHGQKRRKDALGNIADRYRRAEQRAEENRTQLEIDDRRTTPKRDD